jgi:hypothetical protein
VKRRECLQSSAAVVPTLGVLGPTENEPDTMHYIGGSMRTKGVHALNEQLMDEFQTEIVAVLDRYDSPLVGEYMRNKCGYNMVSTFHRKKIANEEWLEGFRRDFRRALYRLENDGEVKLVELVEHGHPALDGYWEATWKEYIKG